jgi:hypothetical protein
MLGAFRPLENETTPEDATESVRSSGRGAKGGIESASGDPDDGEMMRLDVAIRGFARNEAKPNNTQY